MNFGVLEVWIVGYMIAPSVGHFVYASWMYVLVGYMSSLQLKPATKDYT